MAKAGSPELDILVIITPAHEPETILDIPHAAVKHIPVMVTMPFLVRYDIILKPRKMFQEMVYQDDT